MALFNNKADKDLPLLTQLYQAEGEQEVREIATRFFVSGVAYQLATVMTGVSATTQEALERELKREGGNIDMPKALEIWRLARVLMDALADGGEVLGSDYLRLAELDAQGVSKAVYRPGASPTLKYLGGHEVQPESLYSPWQVVLETRIDFFVSRVVFDLKSAMVGILKLVRCQECRSVFVLERSGQQWCSQRCRARVGSRRRYTKLFADFSGTGARKNSGK